jgi:hypothetical protein
MVMMKALIFVLSAFKKIEEVIGVRLCVVVEECAYVILQVFVCLNGFAVY